MHFSFVRASIVLTVAIAAAAPAKADELACRKGVEGKVFASGKMAVPRSRASALRTRLEAWGKQHGMSVGGVGVSDGPGQPEKWSTILTSKGYGVVLTVTTPARGNNAFAKVENNCWARQENWRPYWARLRAQLAAWGYRVH